MDKIVAEKIINRVRFIFVMFLLLLGFSAIKGGSAASVYLSIFISTGILFLICLINLYYIRQGKVLDVVIYISITVEVLSIFLVKFGFHFDEFNGYGLAIKEPTSFIIFIIFAVVAGLRFNKRVVVVYGILTISSYIILVVLGITTGGIFFTKDPKLIFTPLALRYPTEIAKILFMAGNSYFLYLMAGFTTRNVEKLESSKKQYEESLSSINKLFGTVLQTSSDIYSSSNELSSSTEGIGKIINETRSLITEITGIGRDFSKGIGAIRKRIGDQSDLIEDNYNRISDISSFMEEINKETMGQRNEAGDAIILVENNERNISESLNSIDEIQKNSMKIKELSKSINETAEQASHVSLNADNGSPGEGERGPGFAAIAEKMSKVADVSIKSSENISMITKDTVNCVEKVKKSAQDMAADYNSIIKFLKGNSVFIENLNSRTEIKYSESKKLYGSISKMDETSKDVIEHFNNQTELILKVLEWMEKMEKMTETITDNLDSLVSVSERLEYRSVEMNSVIKRVRM